MMMQLTEVDRIRQQMSSVRRRMKPKAKALQNLAEHWYDWRYVVNSLPWFCISAVAGLGYWLVPRRHLEPVVKLDPSSIEAIVQRGVVQKTPQSWFHSTRSFLTNMALKVAAGYVAQQVLQSVSTSHERSPEMETVT